MIKAPENFAGTVKEVRQQLGLSQKVLAHELDMSFSTINRWEMARWFPSHWREGNLRPFVCGIFRGEQLVNMAPSAGRVPKLMAGLLGWIASPRTARLRATG